jgi:hypothetical protein
VAEPIAYCDESQTDGKCYVFAGYIGASSEWEAFDKEWRNALSEEGLTEFKTANCEHGQGQFRGHTDRPRVYKRFRTILINSSLRGVATALDLATYHSLMPRFQAMLADKAKTSHPYYFVWQSTVQLMADLLNKSNLDPEEPMNFVVDVMGGFQGNTADMFEELKAEPWDGSSRLGNIKPGDSIDFPGIQAADLLAYEVRKQAMGKWNDPDGYTMRPQFAELWRNDSPLAVSYFHGDSITKLLERLEEKYRNNLLAEMINMLGGQPQGQ